MDGESLKEKEEESQLPTQEDEITAGARKEAQLALRLRPDMRIVEEARKLASDRNSRINSLVQTISEDPVTTLAVLHAANTSTTAGPRSPTTRLRSAIVRLGSGSTLELLESLEKREGPADPAVAAEIDNLRHLSTQISVVAELISSVNQPALGDSAKTAGLLSQLPYMLACAYFGTQYLELANGRSRSLVTYRLLSEFHYNASAIIIEYLSRHAIPEEMGDIFSTEEMSRPPAQVQMRFLIRSAAEVVEAFAKGKWQRFTNIGELPSQSSLRMLKLTANDYLQLHELVTAYLQPPEPGKEKGEGADENSSPEELAAEKEAAEQEVINIVESAEQTLAELSAESAINNGSEEAQATVDTPTDFMDELSSVLETIELQTIEDTAEDVVETSSEVENSEIDTDSDWSVTTEHNEHDEITEDQNEEVESTVALQTEKIDIVRCLTDICATAASADELLGQVINSFIEYGPYNRALIVSVDPAAATLNISQQAGEHLDDSEPIPLTDPLSPFNLGAASYRSFCPKEIDSKGPLGVGAYAMAPLEIGEEARRTFMYVDCGAGLPLPFDARKIFRLAVEMINKKLPELLG